ncbi:MAG: hypothetical protein QXQ46_06125 [Thermoplasmatales archaeon]
MSAVERLRRKMMERIVDKKTLEERESWRVQVLREANNEIQRRSV